MVCEKASLFQFILKIRFKTNLHDRIGKFYGLVSGISIGVH